jgi:histidinol-phosphatase (PHP family)
MIDYHVHLWPHPEQADERELAVERIATYCELAASRGAGEIALTEHFFRFRQARAVVEGWWDDFEGTELARRHVTSYFDHHATADLDRYFSTIEAAKAAGLPVLAGLEVDYYPGRMAEVDRLLSSYPFDVLLGSVHWLGLWLFDVLEDSLQLAQWESRPIEEVWRAYTAAMEELAACGAVDVLAHPDLVKIGGRYPDQGLVAECERQIAEAAATSGLAAELSSAGARKLGELYPSKSLLGVFFERGVPITFASDTHGPGHIAEKTAQLLGAAQAAGYSALRRFSGRQGRDEAFSGEGLSRGPK